MERVGWLGRCWLQQAFTDQQKPVFASHGVLINGIEADFRFTKCQLVKFISARKNFGRQKNTSGVKMKPLIN